MKFSLNYVWVEATRLRVPANDGITCTVPKALMDNVVATAEAYPNMNVSLWVDLYGIGQHPERILGALNKAVKTPNIAIRALDEIPAYQTNDLFRKQSIDLKYSSDPLWQQVDLARLYVLNHCLVNDGDEAAIYADMDLDLSSQRYVPATNPLLESDCDSGVSLHFAKAVQKLERHGLVVGRETPKITPENQFIGVGSSGYSFFKEKLLPMTADTIRQGWNGWYGHADAFRQMYLAGYGLNLDDIAVPIPSIDPKKAIKQDYVAARTIPEGTGTRTIALAQSSPLPP